MNSKAAIIRDIMQKHAPSLVLYARQFFYRGNFHAAEEVVQEVFLQLTKQSELPENVVPWLYRSVRNGAISLLRSEKRREKRELERIPYFQSEPTSPLDVEEIAEKLELLDQELREIVSLHIWGELPFSEIATLLNKPKSNIFRRYTEALETLRQWFLQPFSEL